MENVRVLVIDDEPSRTLFASILDADGWRIEPGARAEQALELLRQGPWHLVLANLAMTRLDGPPFALLKELAEADGPPQVLFLLPAVSEERLRHSLKQLNLAYTTKPIRLYDLLQQ
ncbi:MAG: response regulator, partial [Terriglobia bacterium]